jgi:divalent metal cation (Fe/Co/Zn/Cd) transporter
MWILVFYKRKIGNALNSAPILADANCTLVCVYMSVILLISSGLYELFGLMYVDSLGSLGLSYYAFKEGRECFFKAKSNVHCSCD